MGEIELYKKTERAEQGIKGRLRILLLYKTF